MGKEVQMLELNVIAILWAISVGLNVYLLLKIKYLKERIEIRELIINNARQEIHNICMGKHKK